MNWHKEKIQIIFKIREKLGKFKKSAIQNADRDEWDVRVVFQEVPEALTELQQLQYPHHPSNSPRLLDHCGGDCGGGGGGRGGRGVRMEFRCSSGDSLCDSSSAGGFGVDLPDWQS